MRPLYLPIFLTIFSFLTMQAQMDPTAFPRTELRNKEIIMKLYLPDVQKGSYRATRFDWSGIIYSVQYKGHEYFAYWKDTHDPNFHEDLSGPAESYKDPGLGYAEARPGDGFIRIGVGVLKKEAEAQFDGFKTYEIIDHGAWKTDIKKKSIRFTHTVSSALGYGYVYTKTIKLNKKQPGFTIEHTLKNTGTKRIQCDQFNHNFFIIDGEPSGPNLELEFPFALSTDSDLKGLVKFEDKKLVFLQPFVKTSVWMQFKDFESTVENHQFTIRDKRSGGAVEVSVDRPLYRMDFWACQTTQSPENYVWIDVEPGKTFTWNADYMLKAE